jgi:hypothetical protein
VNSSKALMPLMNGEAVELPPRMCIRIFTHSDPRSANSGRRSYVCNDFGNSEVVGGS